MAAILESWSIFESVASVTSATVALPPGTVAGEVLLMTATWGTTGASAVPVLPAGFTTLYSAGNLQTRFAIGCRITGASEPANYTATIEGAYSCVASLLRISGADTAQPIANSVITSGNNAAPVSPAITPASDGLLLHVHMGRNNLYTNLVIDSGYPPGDTGVYLRRPPVGNPAAWVGQGIAHRAATAGVAVPDAPWDTGASSGGIWRGISIVIAAAPGGGTGQTIALGSAASSHAVGSIAMAKTITLGSVTDSASVVAPAIAKTITLGAVGDTAAAGGITAHKTATVVSVGEAPLLGGLSAETTVALGAVGEGDLVTALSIGTLLDLAPVAETDQAGALSLGTNVVLSLPPVVETDQVGALALGKAVAVGSVAEAADAGAAGPSKAVALGSVGDAALAGGVGAGKAVSLASVGEIAATAPLAATKAVLLEWVAELDLAGELGTTIVLRFMSVTVAPALSAGVAIAPALSGAVDLVPALSAGVTVEPALSGAVTVGPAISGNVSISI